MDVQRNDSTSGPASPTPSVPAEPAIPAVPAQAGPAGPQQLAAPTCYRHADRECYVRCTRCDNYICPDCMRAAAVGFHCPNCVREGGKTVREARTVFGGRIAGGPPFVTLMLIMLNLVVYVGELKSRTVVDALGMTGRGLMASNGLIAGVPAGMPAAAFPQIGYHAIGVAHGEWYRLLTGAFVHELPTTGAIGIFHIIFNMWWLWRLGPLMERQLGRLRFLALYLIAALGSSVCVFLLDPDQLAIGASGAIFGLVGGYYVLSRKLRHDPLGGSGLLVFFVIWMVLSAGIASWQGHLGGLLAGLAVGAAFAYAPRDKGYAFWQGVGAALVFGLLLLAVGWQTMQLTGTV